MTDVLHLISRNQKQLEIDYISHLAYNQSQLQNKNQPQTGPEFMQIPSSHTQYDLILGGKRNTIDHFSY